MPRYVIVPFKGNEAHPEDWFDILDTSTDTYLEENFEIMEGAVARCLQLNKGEKTYYCTLITLSVLSDQLVPVEQSIGEILEDCDTGPYVLGPVERREYELTKAEMDRALVRAGSDEAFFDYDGEEPEDLYVVRLWDGFDGIWMDVSDPLPRTEADKLCGDKNEARSGSSAGKRTGSYSDIDYYKVFPADTTMRFSGDNSQTGRA